MRSSLPGKIVAGRGCVLLFKFACCYFGSMAEGGVQCKVPCSGWEGDAGQDVCHNYRQTEVTMQLHADVLHAHD